jgi:hypothetical protein
VSSPSRRRSAAGRAAVVVALLVALVVLLAGRGYKPLSAPNLSEAAVPTAFHHLSYPVPGYRIELAAPSNWYATGAKAPLVAVISSGHAVIAIWHYAGSAAAPTTTDSLDGARAALLAAIRQKDPGFKLLAAVVATIDGHGAIVVGGVERVNGHVQDVSSEHIYLSGSEVVLDEYAPPAVFQTVDRLVFQPVRLSLKFAPSSS